MFSQVSVCPWGGVPWPLAPGSFQASGTRSFLGGSPWSLVPCPFQGVPPVLLEGRYPLSWLGVGEWSGVPQSCNWSCSGCPPGQDRRTPHGQDTGGTTLPDRRVSACYAGGGMPLAVFHRMTLLLCDSIFFKSIFQKKCILMSILQRVCRDFVNTRLLVHKHVKISVDKWVLEPLVHTNM